MNFVPYIYADQEAKKKEASDFLSRMELSLFFSPLRCRSLLSPPEKPYIASRFSLPRPFPVFPSSIDASRAATRLRFKPSSCLSRADDGERISELPPSSLSGRDLNSDSLSIWKQMKDIALFAGPATGLWICGPLMSLIDTVVIGQASSLELAALGNSFLFFMYSFSFLGYVLLIWCFFFGWIRAWDCVLW